METLRSGRDAAADEMKSRRSMIVRRECSIDVAADAPWWQVDKAIHDARLRDAADRSSQCVAVLQSAVLLHGGSLKRVPNQGHIWVPWRRKTRAYVGPSLYELTKTDRRDRLAQRPVVNHRMAIDIDRTVVIDGIRVTDLDQTAIHAARFLSPDDAVVAVDSLLAIAVGRDRYWRNDRASLTMHADAVVDRWTRSLSDFKGQRGVAQAREVLASASALAESPLESEVRRIAHAAGFIRVEPQVEVRTRAGLKWVDLGILGVPRGIEIHGDIKFEGEDGAAQLSHEWDRERALADAGFRVRALSGLEVYDQRKVVDALESCFVEYQSRRGLRRLWTPMEARRGL
ncbi:hypothetical protein [Schaalia vaccimaxillae]|uniref:hypothetical protein n=1 Tax=Schaalia vaccimaxillae TaxID=183916 RepID=UPI00104001E8|nr:hypothetical protein [Schaalia vaccimaxillae]